MRRRADYFPYAVIAAACISIFFVPLGNEDELWNYSFAKCISEGLLPYRDISMIVTPLSAYVSAVFVILFGKGLFAFRIAGYVLMAATYELMYFLIRKGLGKIWAAASFVLCLLAINYSFYIYNYNNLSVCLILVILAVEQMPEHRGGDRENGKCVVPLLVGMLPIIKQTTGIFICLVYMAFCLYDRLSFRIKGRQMLLRMALTAFPLLLYVFYLAWNQIFTDFWDYAVLGLAEFTHRYTFVDFMSASPVTLVLGLVPCWIILHMMYFIIWRKDRAREKLFAFAVGLTWYFSVTYPLYDITHYFAGILPLLAAYAMFLGKVDLPEGKTSPIAAVMMVCSIVLLFPAMETGTFSSINHYERIPVDPELEDDIRAVCEYIEQKNGEGFSVYIASDSAAVYMLPLDQYHRNWDLLLAGNVGTATVEELMEVEDHALFLLLKEDYTLNAQLHLGVIDFIKKNYQCVDEVLYFDVYTKG